MLHMLDTNACAGILNRDERFLVQLEQLPAQDVAISQIVLFELRYGICKSVLQERNERELQRLLRFVQVLDFGANEAAEAALIRCELEKRPAPIGPFDVLIAAHARALKATLVTHNTREFARVRGLKTVDWQKA